MQFSQMLCIRGVVTSQHVSRLVAVISVCNDNCDRSCCHYLTQSNSSKYCLIAVVSYDCVLCNTSRLSNSQGKVATMSKAAFVVSSFAFPQYYGSIFPGTPEFTFLTLPVLSNRNYAGIIKTSLRSPVA